ncbi:hypothetical protein MEX01_49790 [Methylorubrum extorquens]|nr:hypothetical protein MEX01_49790 [Methylorubrum extorquens]
MSWVLMNKGGAMGESASLHKLLLRFAQVQYVQTAQTAFVNASYQIEVRLARWLLMCHDRLEGDELRLTHEFLSMMLGVLSTASIYPGLVRTILRHPYRSRWSVVRCTCAAG